MNIKKVIGRRVGAGDGLFGVFRNTAEALVAGSGPDFVMTLGNNPLTTTQSLGPVAQNITRGARVIPCTLWCHTGVPINLSTTVWFWAKNRYSHIFSRCRLKLVCSISFFS